MRIENIIKENYNKTDGYRESIQIGLKRLKSVGKNISSEADMEESKIEYLKNEIKNADAIVIGAGAGLSTSAGFTYSGERFEKYFFDFSKKFGITDMYSGGFYSFPDKETTWAWWARNIYFNRFVKPSKPVYTDLFSIVKDKEYFVITTNVDHQFQVAGFDKKRLFYTQGDYGLFQSVNPQNQNTYDNEEWVFKAIEAQGFKINSEGIFEVPENKEISMKIPTELIPKCPDDSDVTMNLRMDSYFVEDEGWKRASKAYSDFLEKYKDKHILFLELGVGNNTPVIIKYPFWQMAIENKNAVYACINYNEAFCPTQIKDRSICINGDIGEILKKIIK